MDETLARLGLGLVLRVHLSRNHDPLARLVHLNRPKRHRGTKNILRPLLKVRIRQLLETRIVSEGIKHRIKTKKCRG
jgi:hypothetical protein